MTNFLRQALGVLRDEQAAHGLRAVAAGTLLTAFEREVETPTGSAIAVWNWLATVGGDTIKFSKVNFIPGGEVVCRALEALKDPDAGADLQDLAITIVENSPDLSMVSDADMLAIADGEPPPDRARRVVWFVEALHEGKGLPSTLLRALRDRWAASVHLHLRERSVEIAALLPGLDKAYVEPLLVDPLPKVRRAVAALLGAAEGEDSHAAELLLQARLRDEEDPRVRAQLHVALGSLVGV